MMTLLFRSAALAVIAAASFAAAPASADDAPLPNDKRINAEQRHQHRRIAQGVRSGELTKSEAHSLRERERATHAEEKAYKADGSLTRDERTDLRHDLHANSKAIHTEKHDEERR